MTVFILFHSSTRLSHLLAISCVHLQVLEELQKVKSHCEDCEMKNKSLQTQLEALQQQLKVNVLSDQILKYTVMSVVRWQWLKD